MTKAGLGRLKNLFNELPHVTLGPPQGYPDLQGDPIDVAHYRPDDTGAATPIWTCPVRCSCC